METVIQENNTAEEQPERMFTQAEMNAILGERLAREREKYSDYDEYKAKAEAYDAATEASKSDLQKATERADALAKELEGLKKANEERELRERISKETGVPANLLKGGSEEDLKRQAEEILAFAKPNNNYPAVKDAGEVTHLTGGKTRDQFKDWFDSALPR